MEHINQEYDQISKKPISEQEYNRDIIRDLFELVNNKFSLIFQEELKDKKAHKKEKKFSDYQNTISNIKKIRTLLASYTHDPTIHDNLEILSIYHIIGKFKMYISMLPVESALPYTYDISGQILYLLKKRKIKILERINVTPVYYANLTSDYLGKIFSSDTASEIVDYKDKEHNKLKVQTSKENRNQSLLDSFSKYKRYIPQEIEQYLLSSHPDVISGCFLIFFQLHMDLELSRNFQKNKTILIKFFSRVLPSALGLKLFISGKLSEYEIQMKELGITSLISIDTIFGYRVDNVQTDDIVPQVQAWVNAPKYNDNDQSDCISLENLTDIKILGNYKQIFSTHIYGSDTYYASGTANYHKYTTVDGDSEGNGKHKLTKTQLFCEKDPVVIEDELFKKGKFDCIVCTKREAIKKRAVVSTDICSHLVLSRMVSYISSEYRDFPFNHTLMRRNAKMRINFKLQYYFQENVKHPNKYLIIPLDYKRFDTHIKRKSITKMIKLLLRHSSNYQTYKDIIEQDIEKMEHIFDNTYLTYMDLEFKYGDGMLSGWKITNLIESFMNSFFTIQVLKDLKLISYLEYLSCMGDDCLIVLRNPFIPDIIPKICEGYLKYNLLIYDRKNFASTTVAEYLRVMHRPYYVQAYPARYCLSTIFYSTEFRDDKLSLDSYAQIIMGYTCRTGRPYKLPEIIKTFSKMSRSPNIRQNMYTYIYHPSRLNIYQKKKIKSQFDTLDGTFFKKQIYAVKSQWALKLDDNIINKVCKDILTSYNLVEKVRDKVEPKLNFHKMHYLYKPTFEKIKRLLIISGEVTDHHTLPSLPLSTSNYNLDTIIVDSLRLQCRGKSEQEKFNLIRDALSVINVYRYTLQKKPINFQPALNYVIGCKAGYAIDILFDTPKVSIFNMLMNTVFISSKKRNLSDAMINHRFITNSSFNIYKKDFRKYLREYMNNHSLTLLPVWKKECYKYNAHIHVMADME